MDTDNAPATPNSAAQDVNTRIEEKLFGATEEVAVEEEVASEDAPEEELPEDGDTESDDETTSEDDLETIASEEELTLADYLGVEEDRLIVSDDGKVSFNAIIDGESKEIPLAELAKSYQLTGHVNNKSMALETDRKEFEEQKTGMLAELKERVDEVGVMSSIFEDQLVEEFNAIDWDQLRVTNPAEWTALRQEYSDKANKIQSMQAGIQQEGKRIAEEHQRKSVEAQQKYIQAEFQKMIAANPTWSDKEVLAADMGRMRDFATEAYGFTANDMTMVQDHRLISLIQDAQAYRQGKKTAAKKLVKTVPKFQKPGAMKGNSASLAKARSVKAKKAAVKKTGHVNDVAALLVDRM